MEMCLVLEVGLGFGSNRAESLSLEGWLACSGVPNVYIPHKSVLLALYKQHVYDAPFPQLIYVMLYMPYLLFLSFPFHVI